MRLIWALAAAALLAGCDNGGGQGGRAPSELSSSKAEAFAATGGGFDYRYAYRLPGNRVKGVLQSNADACDRLGPARCQISSMRYRVDEGNRPKAVLTIRIDPSIARSYGDAVTANVSGSEGELVDTEIVGTQSSTTARGLALINRLRDQLHTAQSQPTPENIARASKLQSALATITEVEASQGQTLATAPVLLTYESSNALSGPSSSDANFRNAGRTLQNSLAQLVQILAGVGPWLLLMVVIVLVLRWIVHGRAIGGSEPEAAYYQADSDYHTPPAPPHERGSLIGRWLRREP